MDNLPDYEHKNNNLTNQEHSNKNNSLKIDEQADTQPIDFASMQSIEPMPTNAIISDKDMPIPEKKSKWWTVGKIVALVLIIPFVIIFMIQVASFLLLPLSFLTVSLEPDYDINVTKEHWEKEANKFSRFDFTIISEDASVGSLKISLGENQFDYTCKNTLDGGWYTKSFKCHYSFGFDGSGSYFTDYLWFLHKDEIVAILKTTIGEKVNVNERIFVKDASVLTDIFYKLMEIEDYTIFYKCIQENPEGLVNDGHIPVYTESYVAVQWKNLDGTVEDDYRNMEICLFDWALYKDIEITK